MAAHSDGPLTYGLHLYLNSNGLEKTRIGVAHCATYTHQFQIANMTKITPTNRHVTSTIFPS